MGSFRIALVIPGISKYSGGPPFAVAALAENLCRAGHEVTLVTAKVSSDQKWNNDVEVDSGVRVEFFQINNPWNRWLYRSKDLRSWFNRNVRNFDVVDIHGVWSFIAIDVAHSCLRAGIPYILTPHGQMADWDWAKKLLKKKMFFRLFLKNVWNSAAAIRFLSESESNRCVFQPRVPALVIPNPVSLNSRVRKHYSEDGLRREFNIPKDASIILFLGRITEQKGVLELLEAFNHLWQQNLKVFLVIAGPSDRQYGSRVVRMVDGLQCKNNIHLLDAVYGERKVALLSIARVFVTLSKNEGLPLAVLEALAFGIPVVITKDTNLPEVSKYNAGLVVNDQPLDVADALTKVVTDTEAHSRMSQNATRLIQDKFVWEKVLPALISMYENAACSRKVIGSQHEPT